MDNVRHIPHPSADDDGYDQYEAERYVLGGCTHQPKDIPTVRGILDRTDFALPAHELIWDVLGHLHDTGQPITPYTLRLELEKRKELTRAGGPAYLNRLGDYALDAEYHAQLVREQADLRAEADLGRRIVQQATAPDATPGGAVTFIDDYLARQKARDTSPDTGWGFTDLTPVLDGTHKPVQPTIGARDDGIGLFYPGLVNGIQGESEAGKSWVALVACLTEINRGNHVVYMDFEDSEEGVVSRLLLIGATPRDIADRFHYIRPTSTPTPAQLRAVIDRVAALQPTLAIVDGVTEAMVMLGLELKENTEIARFGRMLLRPLAETGAAVVPLDHVVKNNASRGRYALGGVHKLNAVNGVQYMLEAVRPFGINTEGRSRLRIAKDRPAQIRRHALPGGRNPMHWFADLVIRSDGTDFAQASLFPPIERPQEPADRTAEEEKEAQEEQELRDREEVVLKVLEKSAAALSKKALEELISGRASVTRRALTRLVHTGRVTATPGSRGAVLHSIPEPEEGESK